MTSCIMQSQYQKETNHLESVTSPNCFHKHLETFRHLHPSIVEFKQKAWEHYLALPHPTMQDEKWRFSRIANNTFDHYSVNSVIDKECIASIKQHSTHLKNYTSQIIIGNNQCLEKPLLPPELEKKGVLFISIEDALHNHPERILQYCKLSKDELGSEKLLALHMAYIQNGYLLYVPRNIHIEKPFVSYHWTSGQTAIFPTTLIVAEESSSFHVVDFYLSKNIQENGFSCGYSQVWTGNHANVFRKTVQNFNHNTVSYQIDHNIVQKASELKHLAIHLGSKDARLENQIFIQGEHSNVNMYAVSVADNTQVIDQRTLQIHSAANARSNILYKNVLFDKANTIFSGLIKVDPNAQKTDAYQKNRNLLLSSDAEANALPGLEILANDVKCSHGATTGPIDSSELYYLMSRGIPRNQAQELLALGFLEEVIEVIEKEELAELTRTLIASKFSQKSL